MCESRLLPICGSVCAESHKWRKTLLSRSLISPGHQAVSEFSSVPKFTCAIVNSVRTVQWAKLQRDESSNSSHISHEKKPRGSQAEGIGPHQPRGEDANFQDPSLHGRG